VIRLRSYIAGEWRDAGGNGTPLHNPANEEVLAEIGSNPADVGGALDHARAAGRAELGALTFGSRGALLRDLSKLLHGRREELLDIAQANGGNTRSDAKFDVDGAIGTLAAYADVGEALGRRAGDRRFLVDGDAVALTRAPRFAGQHWWITRPGAAVQINAFNFPAWGMCGKAAVALLAGVPVITRPATATALLAHRIMEILVDSRKLPPDSWQLVCGPTGGLLELLGPYDHLAFTGSNATGARLRAAREFAERSVRVNVEADSLNAAVVGPEVEPGSELWNLALKDVVLDVTQKTGQKCTAIRRVLVPASRLDAFEEQLVEELRRVTVGNPTADGVSMGPVSTDAQHRDVLAGIGRLAAENHLVLGSTGRVDGRGAPPGMGWFVAPAVLRASSSGAGAVHDVEVFGPCVTLIAYDGTAAEAARIVALGQGSLVSSAFSDDRTWTEEFALAVSPCLGRILLVSSKLAGQATPPGMVLPGLVHGGPGRAGGGEELGGERGLLF
jgi:3,4-dehydroadipyl-CoA semialdehyde dehydrogenase